jgi:hemoglobin
MSVRSLYERGWDRVQRCLVVGVTRLDTSALALGAGSDAWPIWAVVAHVAGARVFWLCGIFKEPGAETTPFAEPVGSGWEDDLAHPRTADELVNALETSWRIVDSCLDRWTPEMLGETFDRDIGEGRLQAHTRHSVLVRLLTHDSYHTGEISMTLGMHGRTPMDPWTGTSIFEFAGGAPAFLALATAHHQRCLEDPELSHAFSHAGNPDHIQRLADYWGEVFGGPATYSGSHGGHSSMLEIHARTGAGEDFGERFVACFMGAVDDVGLPKDPGFRAALRAYIESAVGEVLAISPADAAVAASMPMPRWSWDGPAK